MITDLQRLGALREKVLYPTSQMPVHHYVTFRVATDQLISV